IIFESDYWMALNRGEITESDIKSYLTVTLKKDASEINSLFDCITAHQIAKPEMVQLLPKIVEKGFGLYAITDNFDENIERLMHENIFFEHFQDIIVSSEVGILKPSSEIFTLLLDRYQLIPEECIFIDDRDVNVHGAMRCKM